MKCSATEQYIFKTQEYLFISATHTFLSLPRGAAAVKAEDSERFKTMVQFECRGLEPVDFQPQVRTEHTPVLYVVKSQLRL